MEILLNRLGKLNFMKIYQGLPGLISLMEDISSSVSGTRRKQIAELKTDEEESTIEFYLTKTGDLLSKNKGKWELFSKECRRW
jgi:hypothetical protein